MKKTKPKPKILRGKKFREYARDTRNWQWKFMERVDSAGTLWFSPWNKDKREQGLDEWRDCLIGGLEIISWVANHEDWFIKGEWDDTRAARPIQLTPAGKAALTNRAPYDLEPVVICLIEPGSIAIPTPA